MQSLIGKNQSAISNIFHESPLPFEDYKKTETRRGEKLAKYVHLKTGNDYAFKIVENEYVARVKNQVTILKKLIDCQNIIHFYGVTFDGCKCYLITEWAEQGNMRKFITERGKSISVKMRLGFACDIVKGLNFLNTVKVGKAFLY
jgi:serine/threonine protein kinase